MVKYSFIVTINGTTTTTILECGKDFQTCLDNLDYRLRFSCEFDSYVVLSAQICL